MGATRRSAGCWGMVNSKARLPATPTGRSRRPLAGRWSPAIATACSTAVTGRKPGATGTTWSGGRAAERRSCQNWHVSAGAIIGCSMKKAGPWSEQEMVTGRRYLQRDGCPRTHGRPDSSSRTGQANKPSGPASADLAGHHPISIRGLHLGVEAAGAAFGASLPQAFLGQREQRNAVEPAALAVGHAGIDREADDVPVWARRVGMFLQDHAEPVGLTNRDPPIGLRDDEAELPVPDAGQRVDPPRLRPDDRDEFPQNPAEPALTILASEDFEGLDLEQHHRKVVVVARRAADLFFKEIFQILLAVGRRLRVEQSELLGLDQLAAHHQRVQTLGDEASQRAQRFLEVVAWTVEAHHDGTEGPLPLRLRDRDTDDAPLLDHVLREIP